MDRLVEFHISFTNTPRVELQPGVVPGLSEVTVNAENLLQLVDGPDVLDGEVELHLCWRAVPEVVRPDLLVVAPPLQQVVQHVGHLPRHRGSRSEENS